MPAPKLIPLNVGDFVVIDSAAFYGRHTVGEVLDMTGSYATLRRVREVDLPVEDREHDVPKRRKRDGILYVIGQDRTDAVATMKAINTAHDNRQDAVKQAEIAYTAAIRALKPAPISN